MGARLALRDADLVYGGAHVGLMGRVADAAVAGGSHVIGVITEALTDREIAHEGIHDLRQVMDMPACKRVMYDEADAFLALPGGVGTMEELFEILCWAYLGLHDKPVGLLNVEGYYDHLLAFLEGSVADGLCKPRVLGLLAVDTDPGPPGRPAAGLRLPARHRSRRRRHRSRRRRRRSTGRRARWPGHRWQHRVMVLPVKPPVKPMLAKASKELPEGDFLYEPKWDGFRCLVFRDGDAVELTSRNEKSLTRYFPELVGPLRAQLPARCVLDGELVVPSANGLDFDLLGQRIHPAESRVQMLAEATPAELVLFDLLALDDLDLRELPFGDRRGTLERLFDDLRPPLHLTPATTDPEVAADWFARFDGAGFDGVVAKPLAGTYEHDKRVQVKVKHHRTVDCVVAGYAEHKNGGVGSLKLGLFDDGVDGGPPRLHHVGVWSAFSAAQRRTLAAELKPLEEGAELGHPWQPEAARLEAAQPGPDQPGSAQPGRRPTARGCRGCPTGGRAAGRRRPGSRCAASGWWKSPARTSAACGSATRPASCAGGPTRTPPTAASTSSTSRSRPSSADLRPPPLRLAAAERVRRGVERSAARSGSVQSALLGGDDLAGAVVEPFPALAGWVGWAGVAGWAGVVGVGCGGSEGPVVAVGGGVVGSAEGGGFVEVGGAAVFPGGFVVDVAVVGGLVASGEDAAAVADGDGAALGGCGEAAGAAEPEGGSGGVDDEGLEVGVAGELGGDGGGDGSAVEGVDVGGEVVGGFDDDDGFGAGRAGVGVGGAAVYEFAERGGAELGGAGHGGAGVLVVAPGVAALAGELGVEGLAEPFTGGAVEVSVQDFGVADGVQ